MVACHTITTPGRGGGGGVLGGCWGGGGRVGGEQAIGIAWEGKGPEKTMALTGDPTTLERSFLKKEPLLGCTSGVGAPPPAAARVLAAAASLSAAAMSCAMRASLCAICWSLSAIWARTVARALSLLCKPNSPHHRICDVRMDTGYLLQLLYFVYLRRL